MYSCRLIYGCEPPALPNALITVLGLAASSEEMRGKMAGTSCWAVNQVPRLTCAFLLTFLLLHHVIRCWPIRIKQVSIENVPLKVGGKRRYLLLLIIARWTYWTRHVVIQEHVGIAVSINTETMCLNDTPEDCLVLTCHSLIHMTIPSLASGTRVHTGVLLGSSITLICREHKTNQTLNSLVKC